MEDIINRDYNLLSIWIKACTLRNVQEIEGDEMAESVIALLFSPESILQEESAKLITRSSRELYKSVSQRIPVTIKSRLDMIVNEEIVDKELFFEKIRFLSKHFEQVPEEELISLAGEMKYADDIKTGFISYPYDCLIWPLSPGSGREVYVHYYDDLNRPAAKLKDIENSSSYFLPLNSVEEYNLQFPDRSFEILKYIDINEE